MIIMEVSLNGVQLARAGRADMNVLDVTIAALGVLGPNSNGTVPIGEGYKLQLHVGGLSQPPDGGPGELLNWNGPHTLDIGDEISVRLTDGESPDAPIHFKPRPEPKKVSRREWEASRDFYLRHRADFETENG